MVALLEIPSFRERVFRIPVEAYYRMDAKLGHKRTELICGVIFERMPPSPLHYTIAKRLQGFLQASVPPGFDVRLASPLTLQDSVPSPDVAVVVGSTDDYEDQHPSTAVLAVEVAISNYTDANVKAELYAEAGVQEYWIIRPLKQCVEVYTKPVEGKYLTDRSVCEPELLTCAHLPGVALDLTNLF